MPMERTPQLIRAALAVLPPARVPRIVIGGYSGGGGAGGGEGVRAEEDGGHAVGGPNGTDSKPVGGHPGGGKGSEGEAAGAHRHRGRQGGRGNGPVVEDTTGGHQGRGVHDGGLAPAVHLKNDADLAPTIHLKNDGGVHDDDLKNSWGSDQKYHLHLDLFTRGSPRSEIWKKAWSSSPLVLHDRRLVLAQEEHASRTSESTASAISAVGAVPDVSHKMAAIMRRHPGPISSFRVDSSQWADDSVLQTWLKLLSDKAASEVTILNLGHKTSTVFPIEEMQSSKLLALHLGFMSIPNLDLLCFNYSALQVLYLFSCSFQGVKLSWIITDCICLRELHIGFCTENLKVHSKSLEMVEIWDSSADWLVIECAPKLTALVTSILPRGDHTRVKPKPCYPQVAISINSAPYLKRMEYLLLPHHRITVNSIPIIKECVAWTSVENMKLGLNLSNRSQRDGLRKILDSLPSLLELCVLRMDEVSRAERFEVSIDCPFDDINHVICVATCLRSFSIENFRGGPAELHMIQSVLRHAPRLLYLHTIPCQSCSRKQIGVVTAEIEGYGRLSQTCQVTHHSPTK